MTTYHSGAGFDVLTEDDGSVVKTHIGGLGEAVGTSGSVGTYRYFQHDHLGSVREVRDDALTAKAAFEYTPYGGAYSAQESWESLGPSDLNRVTRRFTGHELDLRSGNYWTPFRTYSPTISRWLQPDPLGMVDGPNMYAYVGGNPVRFIDPLGADGVDTVDAIANGDLVPSNGGGLGQWSSKKGLDDAAAIADDAHAAGQLVVETASTEVVGGWAVMKLLGSAARYIGRVCGIGKSTAKATSLGLNPATTWGRAETLADHFTRHGADFGANTADEYASMASRFFQESQAAKLPTKIDSRGVIRVFDPKTGTFGSFNPNGTTRTFFRPNSATYFDGQPGTLVQ